MIGPSENLIGPPFRGMGGDCTTAMRQRDVGAVWTILFGLSEVPLRLDLSEAGVGYTTFTSTIKSLRRVLLLSNVLCSTSSCTQKSVFVLFKIMLFHNSLKLPTNPREAKLMHISILKLVRAKYSCTSELRVRILLSRIQELKNRCSLVLVLRPLLHNRMLPRTTKN